MVLHLPFSASAFVPERKITGYLLSERHPTGREKARFFHGLSFTNARPEQLRAALLDVARRGILTRILPSRFGSKYVVEGYVNGPEGASARIRTVWILEPGSIRPRFVTAYPSPLSKETDR